MPSIGSRIQVTLSGSILPPRSSPSIASLGRNRVITARITSSDAVSMWVTASVAEDLVSTQRVGSVVVDHLHRCTCRLHGHIQQVAGRLRSGHGSCSTRRGLEGVRTATTATPPAKPEAAHQRDEAGGEWTEIAQAPERRSDQAAGRPTQEDRREGRHPRPQRGSAVSGPDAAELALCRLTARILRCGESRYRSGGPWQTARVELWSVGGAVIESEVLEAASIDHASTAVGSPGVLMVKNVRHGGHSTGPHPVG
ncbi:MAG: hypothetical protein M5U19_07790 [Microthrixaceae bacterium]|nr:hypothetical protein [Microthrixaceae bacterium]